MLPVLLVEVQALHAALPKVAALLVLLSLLPKGDKRLDRLKKVEASFSASLSVPGRQNV